MEAFIIPFSNKPLFCLTKKNNYNKKYSAVSNTAKLTLKKMV